MQKYKQVKKRKRTQVKRLEMQEWNANEGGFIDVSLMYRANFIAGLKMTVLSLSTEMSAPVCRMRCSMA